MSQAFVGQIQPFAFNFAPRYWAQCNGQIMGVTQNTALYSLLGTMYGGNGSTTFGLPNLQSRVPMHAGTSPAGNTYVQGEFGGAESVTITIPTMPSHNHSFMGSSANANDTQPNDGSVLAKIVNNKGTAAPYYAVDTVPQAINPQSIGMAGSNLPHNNLQPYLAINWCICTHGVYPSRN